jgi:hypothetical protein
MPFLFVCSNQLPGIGLRQALLDPKMIAVFIPAPHRPNGFEYFYRNLFNLLCHLTSPFKVLDNLLDNNAIFEIS